MVARVLLDSVSLVSNRVAQTLQLPKTSTQVSFSGAQATPLQGAYSVTTLNLCPTHSAQPVLAVTAAIVNKVTCDLPLQGAAHVREMPHIKSLKLADPTFHLPGRIDLLLGCDVIPDIMLPDHITGPKQVPMACSTVFGWAILGKYSPQSPQQALNVISPVVQETVQQYFAATHKYIDPLGHYQVSLPRKGSLPPLGLSRPQAVQCFLSNERSVQRKGTWDSFQTTTSLSLNDTLSTGPTLYPTLETILLRFRRHQVAITADISKMYGAVHLDSSDRNLHRFLWREQSSGPLIDYRMTRVTFGVSASPYLAVKALQQTAVDFGHLYPLASPLVSEAFYVDDLLTGADMPDQALKLHQGLRALLLKGFLT